MTDKKKKAETKAQSANIPHLPAVSVVIPMYNSARYIASCLTSVLNQTLTNFEIICVDDGSTDDTAKIVTEFTKKDERIKLYRHANNSGGASEPRNTGMRLSRGKYIAFLDSDDLYTGTALAELVTIAEKFQADVVHTEQLYRPENRTIDGTTVTKLIPFSKETGDFCKEPVLETDKLAERVAMFHEGRFFGQIQNKLYRRDYLVGKNLYFDNLSVSEDMIFYFKVLCTAPRIVRVPNIVYIYGNNPESVTRKQVSDAEALHSLIQFMIEGAKILDDFMSHFEFFSKNSILRRLPTDYIIQQHLTGTQRFYDKYETTQIEILLRKELKKYCGNAMPFFAYILDALHTYRKQIISRLKENQALTAQKDEELKALTAQKDEELKALTAQKDKELKALAAQKEEELKALAAQKEEELKALAAQKDEELKALTAQKDEELKALTAQKDKELKALAAQKEEELKALTAQKDEELKALAAQKDEELKALTAQKDKSTAQTSKPKNIPPLVSVVIPMYNAAKFIPQTLTSLLYQTMNNFEVIVVDDCSTDNSFEVAGIFKEKFGDRIRIAKTRKHSGTPGLLRNAGIQVARGKYIAFLDVNELYTKTALEEMTTLAEKFKADVIRLQNNFILWGGQKSIDDPAMTNFAELTNPKNFTLQSYAKENLTEPTLETQDIGERVRKWMGVAQNSPYLQFFRRDFLVENKISFPLDPNDKDSSFSFAALSLAKNYLNAPNAVHIVRA